ncbi:MAG: hypothetical protein QGG71_18690 [Pirellulaceae bacterium]|nr:hypothetical protein [Pirellulaceae bacterium]
MNRCAGASLSPASTVMTLSFSNSTTPQIQVIDRPALPFSARDNEQRICKSTQRATSIVESVEGRIEDGFHPSHADFESIETFADASR